MLAARRVGRNPVESEVLRRVVAEQEELAVVVLERVQHPLSPRRHEDRVGLRAVRRDQVQLRRHGALGGDDDECLVLGEVDAHPETLVRLLEHQRVARRIGVEAVAPHLERALGGVRPRVEEGLVVGGEGEAGEGAFDAVGKVLARREVPHLDDHELAAREVRRPGEKPLVRADGQVAYLVVRVSLGELVLVEDDDLVLILAGGRRGWGGGRPAAVARELEAVDRPRVVGPLPFFGGDTHVAQLHPGEHRLEQLSFHSGEVTSRCLGELVLSLEDRQHFRVVAVAQPVPVVDPLVAVGPHDSRAPICRGRLPSLCHNAQPTGRESGSGWAATQVVVTIYVVETTISTTERVNA